MDIKLSAEQKRFREKAAAWIARDFPFAERTEWADTDRFHRGLLENGWLEEILPDPSDLVESAIRAALIAEAVGAAVICDGFFRSAYAVVNILMETGRSDHFNAARAAVKDGKRMAVAALEPGRGFALDPQSVAASDDDETWTLTGPKAAIVDGADADLLLVSAAIGDEPALFLVEGNTGQKRTAYRTIDGLRAADIEFAGANGKLVVRGTDAMRALERGLHRTFTALAAEALGACDTAIADTAEYAGQREQFGRPIGKFQVIAHRLARMFIEADTLRGSVLNALSVSEADAQKRARAAEGTKVLLSESGRYVVQQAIQVHGGVGVLENRRVAHCYKLLTSIDAFFGTGDEHLGRYAESVG
ncbi:MAG: hypothetical protein JJ913_17495 [Rhizobiaceae bacterium]|nr:hypothetical protein [Rhizobiaceae bacterium]